MSLGSRYLRWCSGKGHGHEQSLCGHVCAFVTLGPLLLQPLIDDALVGGVHIDHDQALGVFRQDIDAVQLRQCATQGPSRRCRDCCG